MNWIRARASRTEYAKWENWAHRSPTPTTRSRRRCDRTSMGNDADPLNLWVASLRMGMVDNFAGLMLATDLSDIIFGIPTPKVVTGELFGPEGRGGEHRLPRAQPDASPPRGGVGRPARGGGEGGRGGAGERGRDLLHRERAGDAVRRPLRGHEAQTELFLATGAIDAMVVDMQCIMPSVLPVIAKCYKTRFITTVPSSGTRRRSTSTSGPRRRTSGRRRSSGTGSRRTRIGRPPGSVSGSPTSRRSC